ncbi:MAG: bifunctional hydroxymethylpyrimidine kinase/phosphomethylpyrimidine kinase [Calditrichaeota bacterium]|nr:bifunctional hydroxymethylpyrimidine kinase/phosphomethylpyrimidine kinase [Calditrichota bacterium]
MSILVVGSIAYDSVETPFGQMDNALGGSSLYFSAAASMFTSVNVVGVVGKDFNHQEIQFLEEKNVNFDGVTVETGDTFRWGGRYHQNMNKRDTLYTYLNVFETFKPSIPEQYKNSEYIFLANIDPELQLQVLEQVNKPKLVILDTMNFWITGKKEFLEKVIKRVDIVILNDEELKEFTNEDNLVSGAKKLVSMGPKQIVIKRGEYGAVLFSNDNFFFAPAFPLEKVVDPTGAGDTFAGGFVGYLAAQKQIDEKTIRNAVLYGSTTASFTVEDFSLLRLKRLTKEEMENRFNKFKEMITF